MTSPPNRDHTISLDAAAAMTRRYREAAGADAQRATMFPRQVFDVLLAQPGCVVIRMYYGQTEGGGRELVLVGVDSTGNDMTSAALFDYGLPCPPYCGGDSPLNGE